MSSELVKAYLSAEVSLGRAVQNGVIRFLSVSQIVIFSALYEGGCNRRWAFQYLFGKKEEETKRQQAGKVYATALEHYFKTGEPVLLPALRAAQHFFPKPGPDIEAEQPLSSNPERAIELREKYVKATDATARATLADEMRRIAGLTANNIPVVGKPDFRHRRGEYIDAQGILKNEEPGRIVTEIGDLKTTSRINDYWSKNGDGKLHKGNAKTAEEVLHHPQSLGYGVHEINRHPEVTHLRLSFIYAQTEHGTAAAKRGGLLEAAEVVERWRKVESIAREMEQVAHVSRPEEAPPNLSSCIHFNKPCPHADYCDRPKGTVLDLFQIRKDNVMADQGLFSSVSPANTNGATPAPASAPQMGLFGGGGLAAPIAPTIGLFSPPQAQTALPPSLPPLSDVERAAAEQAEIQRLIAEDAARQAASALPSIGAINPADGKVPPLSEAASPLAPEAIAEITNPALKAKVEQHAAEAAERKRQEEANQPKKKGGRCPASETRLELTREQLGNRNKTKVACPGCQKPLKIADDAITTDFAAMMISKHNIPKEASAPPLPTTTATPPPLPMTANEAQLMQAERGLPDNAVIATTRAAPPLPAGLFGAPPPAVAAVAFGGAPSVAVAADSAGITLTVPRALSVEIAQVPALPALPTAEPVLESQPRGVRLYVDMVFEKGSSPPSIEDWYQDLVRTLTQKAGLQDLRYAPDKHDLGYGRWKGALAAMVPANPLPPGEYLFRGVAESEMKQVVLEALIPLCERVARGGK